jgi:5-fold beta-flower protein
LGAEKSLKITWVKTGLYSTLEDARKLFKTPLFIVRLVKEDDMGKVKSLVGIPVGSIDNDGGIHNMLGIKVGWVDENGQVYNLFHKNVGSVEQDGTIKSILGVRVGSVHMDGTIYSLLNIKAGQANPNDGLTRIGAAALLLGIV